jgi:hypothetical protein
LNGGFVPVSEDELQKREGREKQTKTSGIIIHNRVCDRASGMNKSMSSHANTSGAQLNINFV